MSKIKEFLATSKAAPIWVWLLVFGAGSVSGGSSNPQVITKTVEKPADLSEWKQLKELDDQIIKLSSDGFLVASDAMGHLASGDLQSALDESNKLSGMTGQMRELSASRQALMKKLGY